MGKRASRKHKSAGARSKAGYEKMALQLPHIKDPRDPTNRTPQADILTARRKRGLEIMSDWTVQLALDVIAEVLNNREVMGHDVFGAKRLMRVCEAFNKVWPDRIKALTTHDEAEAQRVIVDQKQARIFGPDYLRWHERYPWWDQNDTY
ncbi:MAG: hypothetical protein J6M06_01900 [Synergistaceae bacterium]|nr:hypothetical protein [Synergistaceae bacterium]